MPPRLEGGSHVPVGIAVARDDTMANNDSGNIVTSRSQHRVYPVTLFGGFKSGFQHKRGLEPGQYFPSAGDDFRFVALDVDLDEIQPIQFSICDKRVEGCLGNLQGPFLFASDKRPVEA